MLLLLSLHLAKLNNLPKLVSGRTSWLLPTTLLKIFQLLSPSWWQAVFYILSQHTDLGVGNKGHSGPPLQCCGVCFSHMLSLRLSLSSLEWTTGTRWIGSDCFYLQHSLIPFKVLKRLKEWMYHLGIKLFIVFKVKNVAHSTQGSVNLLFEEPESKYFRSFWPSSICPHNSALPSGVWKQPQTIHK